MIRTWSSWLPTFRVVVGASVVLTNGPASSTIRTGTYHRRPNPKSNHEWRQPPPMANDHKRSAYTQDQDFGGDDLRARTHECQAAMHARADELAGRPPSEKQRKHAAKG